MSRQLAPGATERLSGAAARPANHTGPRWEADITSGGDATKCRGEGKPKHLNFKVVSRVAIAAAVVICFVVGCIMEAIDTNTVEPDPYSCAQKQQLGYTLAAAGVVEPWDPAQSELKSVLLTAAMVTLRMVVVPPLVARWFPHLTKDKQAKIRLYVFEITTTTAALVLLSMAGGWRLFFNPAGYYPQPTPDDAWEISMAMNMCANIIVFAYLIELASEPDMRYELQLHHVIAIILIIWGIPAVYISKGSPRFARLPACMFLYMVTEQNVFIGMLAYYSGVKKAWLFRASAWFYVCTRMAITVLCIVSFVDLTNSDDRLDMWGTRHNSKFVYGWYAIALPAVIGLGVVQLISAQSLFGIARKVANRGITNSEVLEGQIGAVHARTTV